MKPSPLWFAPVACFAFGTSLLAVFRIEFRENAILFLLSEIPLVFAIVYLPPVTGVFSRLVGSVIVFVLVKRLPLHKLLFNLSMFTFEIAIAYFLLRHLPHNNEDSAVVMAAAVSVTVAGIFGSVAVALAVSRFSGDTLRHIVDELKSDWVIVVNASMAGILLALFLVSAPLAGFSMIPMVALWFMMRRQGELSQRLRDLRDIHGFAGRVGRSLDIHEIGASATSEASRLLRADTAILTVLSADGSALVFGTGAVTDSVSDQREALYWAPLSGGVVADLTTGAELAARGLSELAVLDDVIVVGVDDEIGEIGLLVLSRQSASGQPFTHEDLVQAQNLADQLASSLRKGTLHRQIEFEARHDPLTGLPNRLAFEQQLDAVALCAPGDRPDFVLMMDLDRFKEVNDTLGHHAGDDLLREFSKRIATRLGPRHFLCRLAGDEFAAIVHCADEEEVFDLARSCIEDAARPVILDGLSIVITASVGIASITADDIDSQTALRHADIAMYNAKSHHIGVEFFRPEIDRRTPARLSMLGDLRQAIEQGELGIEYQPKLDLASGLITGVEALVRWNHVVRGVVSPAEFVRVAEDTGLIKQLTDLMLARGIVELARWHDQGHHLTLSVNLSTHDLLDTNLPSRVDRYLRDSAVDPGSLTLEITESSLLIDAPRSQGTIHELNELGVRLSIDDFGTGYSSLSYLRQLPVRELKVDQSFIANMLLDQQDEVIVRSTIDLGHNLGLEVVAEGVESDSVINQLREFGCDVAQGFCVSRPLSASRLQTWLHTTSHPIRAIDPLEPRSWPIDIADRVVDEQDHDARPAGH